MAAAPDLLDACEYVDEWLKAGDPEEDRRHMWKLVERAIANARGGR